MEKLPKFIEAKLDEYALYGKDKGWSAVANVSLLLDILKELKKLNKTLGECYDKKESNTSPKRAKQVPNNRKSS